MRTTSRGRSRCGPVRPGPSRSAGPSKSDDTGPRSRLARAPPAPLRQLVVPASPELDEAEAVAEGVAEDRDLPPDLIPDAALELRARCDRAGHGGLQVVHDDVE